jgi:hypothetical protein
MFIERALMLPLLLGIVLVPSIFTLALGARRMPAWRCANLERELFARWSRLSPASKAQTLRKFYGNGLGSVAAAPLGRREMDVQFSNLLAPLRGRLADFDDCLERMKGSILTLLDESSSEMPVTDAEHGL